MGSDAVRVENKSNARERKKKKRKYLRLLMTKEIFVVRVIRTIMRECSCKSRFSSLSLTKRNLNEARFHSSSNELELFMWFECRCIVCLRKCLMPCFINTVLNVLLLYICKKFIFYMYKKFLFHILCISVQSNVCVLCIFVYLNFLQVSKSIVFEWKYVDTAYSLKICVKLCKAIFNQVSITFDYLF